MVGKFRKWVAKLVMSSRAPSANHIPSPPSAAQLLERATRIQCKGIIIDLKKRQASQLVSDTCFNG